MAWRVGAKGSRRAQGWGATPGPQRGAELGLHSCSGQGDPTAGTPRALPGRGALICSGLGAARGGPASPPSPRGLRGGCQAPPATTAMATPRGSHRCSAGEGLIQTRSPPPHLPAPPCAGAPPAPDANPPASREVKSLPRPPGVQTFLRSYEQPPPPPAHSRGCPHPPRAAAPHPWKHQPSPVAPLCTNRAGRSPAASRRGGTGPFPAHHHGAGLPPIHRAPEPRGGDRSPARPRNRSVPPRTG